ncbi:hypothetical protein GH733_001646 [Mirounga leonina]|nr:hypothetical protein GH733_001646 [Mirounga leonina]
MVEAQKFSHSSALPQSQKAAKLRREDTQIFRVIKRFLAKKQKQNRPIPQWIRMKTVFKPFQTGISPPHSAENATGNVTDLLMAKFGGFFYVLMGFYYSHQDPQPKAFGRALEHLPISEASAK